MITADDLRARFPELANKATYPDTTINIWIPDAYAQLNARRFGAQLDLAAALFVAHNVVLSVREVAASKTGMIAGEVRGPVTAESVDKVSISYSSETAIEGAGAWNFTSYGQRLYKMMKSFGLGPFYAPNRGRRTPW